MSGDEIQHINPYTIAFPRVNGKNRNWADAACAEGLQYKFDGSGSRIA